MLYVNSRDKVQTYTAFRVLNENLSTTSGVIAPLRLQPLSPEQLDRIRTGDFYDAVAEILNHFFSTHLERRHLELGLGRRAVSLNQIPHKIWTAETWHNPGNTYAYLEEAAYRMLSQNHTPIPAWVRIAIRTAILFGVYSLLDKQGIHTIDVAGTSEDCTTYLAPFFARMLGLPIRTIVIGCDEDSGIWEFLHRGQLPANSTSTRDLELLVFTLFGEGEAARLGLSQAQKRPYMICEEQRTLLSDSFYAAVSSKDRREKIIASSSGTNTIRFSKDSAVSYIAIQDFRAKTGERSDILFLDDRNPGF